VPAAAFTCGAGAARWLRTFIARRALAAVNVPSLLRVGAFLIK
jgi:hypothetical protein